LPTCCSASPPVVLKGVETIEAWEEFKNGIVESWQPVNTYELEIAESIAFNLWRRRRCRMHETMVLNRQVAEVEAELQQSDADDDDEEAWPEIEPERLRAHQRVKLIPDGWSIDRILRYDTQVNKDLYQDVHELEVRQAHREGERPPLTRVDFNSAPGLLPRRPAADASSALQQVNESLRHTERGLAARKRAARAAKNGGGS